MTPLVRNIGLLYFRTSTHEQFKKISPDLQRKECLALARRDGVEVMESRDIYWDDESAFVGKGSKRPGFQRMTERWKTDPRVRSVYIYDLSRLFRDARAYFNYKYELDEKGVELVSVIEPLLRENTPAARLPAGVIALVNEYNSALYGAKIRDAMKFKAEAGVYPGKARFGYRNVREEGEGKQRAWIEVNEEEAPWVNKAFMLYAEGTYSIPSLADRLAQEGFPTRNGRPLHPSVLEDILKNRIYIGWVEWGPTSNPNGKQVQLVDHETFHRVQAILAAHNHGASRKRKHTFLLRGLLKCGECGSRIQAGYSRGKCGRYYGFYQCPKRQGGTKTACIQRTIPLDELEQKIEILIHEYELSPDGVRAVERRIEETLGDRQKLYEATKRTIERSLADILTAKKKAFLKFATDEVQNDVFSAAMKSLAEDETKLRDQLDRLEGDLSIILRAVRVAVDLARDLPRAYRLASKPVRTLLLRAFFESLIVKDGRIIDPILSPPVAFVCRRERKKELEFELAVPGGDTRSLIEPLRTGTTPLLLQRLEQAHRAVLALRGTIGGGQALAA